MRWKLKVLHISDNPIKNRLKWFVDYKFFDYTTFKQEDNIIGMYQRLFSLSLFYKPLFIIIDFKHPDMINEMEKKTLRKLGFIVEFKNVKNDSL